MKKLNLLVVFFCLSSALQLSSQVNSSLCNVSAMSKKTNAVLPEVLLSFDAIISDKKVELTWSSNTENNNNYFTIEKSKDAINFEDVTSIKGFGNHSSLVNYFDVDYIPYEGISYYRLKQTDSKGHTLSSRLVSVNYRLGNDGLATNQNSVDENTTNLLGSENKEVLRRSARAARSPASSPDVSRGTAPGRQAPAGSGRGSFHALPIARAHLARCASRCSSFIFGWKVFSAFHARRISSGREFSLSERKVVS